MAELTLGHDTFVTRVRRKLRGFEPRDPHASRIGADKTLGAYTELQNALILPRGGHQDVNL